MISNFDNGYFFNYPNAILDYLTDNVGLFDSFIDFLNDIKVQADHFFNFTINDFGNLPQLVRNFAILLVCIAIIKTILSLGGASG